MAYVATVVNGFDDKSRLLRRTIMRYMQLGSLIVFQMTSPSVKKRFPTQQHLIAAGIPHSTIYYANNKNKIPYRNNSERSRDSH